MKQQIENQSPENTRLGTDMFDIWSGIGLVGGTVASLISQQVAVAAIPISLAVALNIASRRRMETENQQMQQAAIANLHQYHKGSQSHFSEQLRQLQQTSNMQLSQQAQTQQERLKHLSGDLEKLQQVISDITQESMQAQQATQNLESQQKHLESVVEELRQIENFSQALTNRPDGAEFYYQRGLSHQRLGDQIEAIEDYTEALRLDPTHANAYHNRGILNAELGNKKRAVEDLRQAAKFYFEQGDIDNYQKARNLSKEFYELRYSLNKTFDDPILDDLEDEEESPLVLSSLFA